MSPRVVITGVGVTSPIGHSIPELTEALRDGRSGIRPVPEWADVGQLGCRVAGPVEGIDLKGRWPRKKSRTLGRVAALAAFSTELAIEDAGLSTDDLHGDEVGLAYGSTHGSSSAQEVFCRSLFTNNSLARIPSSAYLKFMSHTCAANLASFFGIRGRVLSTSAACVSGSQAIGAGFESIRSGATDMMVCGGAEELHFMHAGIFDMLYAASTKHNDAPDTTPRPYDRDRDGLVVAEGAGTVVLETLERAQARGARIHAELLGYGTSCDGTHLTFPSVDGMSRALALAMRSAKIGPADIDYINGHGTATKAGDICESAATLDTVGATTPISSTKGQMGHTLGACGAIELAVCLAMMEAGFIAPTRNLEVVDPECRDIDFVKGELREATLDTVMTNNFAFGGINTSLILRRMA